MLITAKWANSGQSQNLKPDQGGIERFSHGLPILVYLTFFFYIEHVWILSLSIILNNDF